MFYELHRTAIHILGVSPTVNLWKPVYSLPGSTCLANSMPPRSTENPDLRPGLRLFNQRHFFDAHEVLEDLWRPIPRDRVSRCHLQGLVQLAVAFHHASRDNFLGARSVLDRALRNLAGAEISFPTLNFDRLRADLAPWQQYLAATSAKPSRCPAWPKIALTKTASTKTPPSKSRNKTPRRTHKAAASPKPHRPRR